jgi:hypothetical protein
VQPDLGHERLAIVPQVPPNQATIAGRDIRLGHGSVDVRASASGHTYRTQIQVSRGVDADHVTIGYTLAHGARPLSVRLDGRTVHKYRVVDTNRGAEVTVATGPGQHTLVVTA